MEVICIEDAAYFDLLEKVYQYIKTLHNVKQDKWILPEEAMEMLGVKKTKLQELRDTDAIGFSQPSRKVILYDSDSIREYLEKNTRKSS